MKSAKSSATKSEHYINIFATADFTSFYIYTNADNKQ